MGWLVNLPGFRRLLAQGRSKMLSLALYLALSPSCDTMIFKEMGQCCGECLSSRTFIEDAPSFAL